MATPDQASRVKLAIVTVGTAPTRVAGSATYWRWIGLTPVTPTSLLYVSEQRNFSTVTGFPIPASVAVGGGGGTQNVVPITWFPWPPGVDMWMLSTANGTAAGVAEIPMPVGAGRLAATPFG